MNLRPVRARRAANPRKVRPRIDPSRDDLIHESVAEALIKTDGIDIGTLERAIDNGRHSSDADDADDDEYFESAGRGDL